MNLMELDALIYEVIVDANGEDEQLWAFRQACGSSVSREHKSVSLFGRLP
jgi:hypothetical protein